MLPETGRIALIHVTEQEYTTLDQTGKLIAEDSSIYDLRQVDKVIVTFDNGRNGIRCNVDSCQKHQYISAYRLSLTKLV